MDGCGVNEGERGCGHTLIDGHGQGWLVGLLEAV